MQHPNGNRTVSRVLCNVTMSQDIKLTMGRIRLLASWIKKGQALQMIYISRLLKIGGSIFYMLSLLLLLVRPAASGPIRIGATVSHSGTYQATSQMMQDAYWLWAQQINAAGGLLGQKVELIFYDDQSDTARVRQFYEKLITKDKVDLVLSPYGSPLTLAAAEVTEKYNFLLLASAASARSIWERGFKRVYGVYATADRYFIGFLDLIARKRLHSVVIGYENTSFATSAAEGARQWGNRFGLEVKLFEAFDKKNPRLPALLDKMQAADADALILCAYPADVYRFLALMKQRGYRSRALGFTIAPALQEFSEKAGSMAENVFGPSQWEPDARVPFPGTRKFIKDFKSYANRQPSYHAGASFAACQILERAIHQTRSLDQDKLAKFISSMDTVTVIGRFKVDHTGRQIGHNPILIQWQHGRKQIVYPAKLRTAAPIITCKPAE